MTPAREARREAWRPSMHKQKIVVAVLAASVAMPAMTAGDGDLWILPVALACAAQYPELRNTQMASGFLKEAIFVDQIEKARVCLERRKWSAEALCTELMHLDPGLKNLEPGHFDKMAAKYRSELATVFEEIDCTWPKDPASKGKQ